MLLQAIGHYGSDKKVLEIQGEIYGAKPQPTCHRIMQQSDMVLSFLTS
jgi:hypothetical protein